MSHPIHHPWRIFQGVWNMMEIDKIIYWHEVEGNKYFALLFEYQIMK